MRPLSTTFLEQGRDLSSIAHIDKSVITMRVTIKEMKAASLDVVRAQVGIDEIVSSHDQHQCLLESFDMYLKPLTLSPNSEPMQIGVFRYHKELISDGAQEWALQVVPVQAPVSIGTSCSSDGLLLRDASFADSRAQ